MLISLLTADTKPIKDGLQSPLIRSEGGHQGAKKCKDQDKARSQHG
jgi:hypothetical protein